MSREQDPTAVGHGTPLSLFSRLCGRMTWEPASSAPGAFKVPFAILIALAFVPRALVLVFTRPYLQPDTIGYQALANAFLHGDFAGYNGIRTPGYPLLLALFANNVQVTRMAQLLIGLAITGLLFFTALRLTGRPWAAFVAGALYGLNLQQILFESTILSETLATGLLVVAVWLLCLNLVGPPSAHPRVQLIALGLACAALALTRPAFAVVPIIALFAVLPVLRPRLVVVFAVLVPSVVLLCAWSTFNWVQIGQFTPSTITGPALVSHVLPSIPDAGDKYADFRDAYVRMGLQQPSVALTEWTLAGTVSERTNRSLPSVYQEMTPLAVSLIASHPGHYAGTFAKAAAWFWKGAGRGSMPWRTASGPLSLAWLGQKLLLFIACGMLFLLTALLTALCLVRRDRPGTRVRRAWCSIGLLVIVSCVVQALTQYGSNARYGVPLQPLWGLAVVVWVSLWIDGRRRPIG